MGSLISRAKFFRIVRHGRLCITVAVVLLGLLIALMAYSASRIEVVPPKAVKKELRGDLAVVRASFSVKNGGWFSVNGLALSLRVYNSSGFLLAENDTAIGNVGPGAEVRGEVVFCVNVTELFEEGAAYNVFHSDLLHVRVEASGVYAGLVPFEVKGLYKYAWEAPVRSIRATVVDCSPRFQEGRAYLDLTFRVDYDGDVVVRDIALSFSARNSTCTVGEWKGVLPVLEPGSHVYAVSCALGREHVRYFLTHDSLLVLKVCASAYGLVECREASYSWGAPFYRINVTGAVASASNVTVIVEGDNHDGELSIRYRAEVYDEQGFLGGEEGNATIPSGAYSLEIVVHVDRQPSGPLTVIFYVLEPVSFGPLRYEQG